MTKIIIERYSDDLDVSLGTHKKEGILIDRYSGEIHSDSTCSKFISVFANLLTVFGFAIETIQDSTNDFNFYDGEIIETK